MALPTSGPLRFSSIQSVLGGSAPISLGEYYGVASGIPNLGTIKASDFYGKSPSVPTSGLVLWLDAENYTSGSSEWKNKTGRNEYNFRVYNPDQALATSGGVKFMDLTRVATGGAILAMDIPSRDLQVPAYANATFVCFSSIVNTTADWRTLLRTHEFPLPDPIVHQVIMQAGSNDLGAYYGSYRSTGLNVSTLSSPYTRMNMWVFRLSGTTSPYMRVSYNSATTIAQLTDPGAAYVNGFSRLGSNLNSQGWGNIAQCLYYSRHLTDTEIVGLYNTFRGRYGLPAQPDVPTSGLVLWLDAEDYVAGSSVWANKTGQSAYDFRVYNPDQALATSGGVKFMDLTRVGAGGATLAMDITSASQQVPAYANATFVCFTGILNTTADWRTLLRAFQSTPETYHVMIQPGTNLLGAWLNAAYRSTGLNITTLSNPYSRMNMWVFRLSGTTSPYMRVSYNSAATIAQLTDVSAAFVTGFSRIGSNTSSQPWGNIAQCLYYSRHLTDTEIVGLYNAFKGRYGLP